MSEVSPPADAARQQRRRHQHWLSALAVATLLNLAITGLAAWRASRFFDYMGLHATRRQLSRLGLFDEHGEDVDDPAATAAPPAGEPRA